MDAEITFNALSYMIEQMSLEQLRDFDLNTELAQLFLRFLDQEQTLDIIMKKEIRLYGNINNFVDHFMATSFNTAQTMANGPEKINKKRNLLIILNRMLTYPELSARHRDNVNYMIGILSSASAPAAGGRRRRKTRRRLRRR